MSEIINYFEIYVLNNDSRWEPDGYDMKTIETVRMETGGFARCEAKNEAIELIRNGGEPYKEYAVLEIFKIET